MVSWCHVATTRLQCPTYRGTDIVKRIRLLTFPLLLLMSACITDSSRGITIDGGDSGTTIEIQEGTSLSIRLDGNPTTGYNWDVSAVDESVLRYVESDFDPDSDAIGSGGTVTLEFETVSPGATLLELIYRPDWEPPSDAHLRYTVTVRVE